MDGSERKAVGSVESPVAVATPEVEAARQAILAFLAWNEEKNAQTETADPEAVSNGTT